MKRFCQWPYPVIAVLVFLLVNDRTTNSQQIKIVKSPDQPQLTLTCVKIDDAHQLRINVGNMSLETTEFRAIHDDGSTTKASATNGMVRVAHQQSTLEARQMSFSLDNGVLGKERKGLFGFGK